MTAVRTLEANAYKQGKWWMVSIPEIDGLTQCKNIEQIPAQAADLAAISLDVPADQVAIKVSYRLPEDASAAAESWHQAQRQLTAAKTDAEQRFADYARTLKSEGYTLKDIGTLTGYTFQRIAQILKQGSSTEQEAIQRMTNVFFDRIGANEGAKSDEDVQGGATFSTVQLSGGNRVALLHTRTNETDVPSS